MKADDAISRQQAIDTFYEYPNVSWTTLDILEKINSLPPVNPAEKVGQWIEIKNKRGTAVALRCSRCKNSPKYAIWSDYCPKCGAKMQEVEE